MSSAKKAKEAKEAKEAKGALDPSTFDELAKELAEQIASNEALLRGLKYEYGQQLLEAQQGGGDAPQPLLLVQIKQLELTLQNDRMFLEARELTRRKP
jgi:hypothetical protein